MKKQGVILVEIFLEHLKFGKFNLHSLEVD